MSRNEEMHFSSNPTNIDIPRSVFNIPSDHKTTLNTGELTPIYCAETLPGDTVEINLSTLIRMSTPIYPVMDNCVCDIYFFSIPSRLLWTHWKEFMGENTQSYWTPEVEYSMPQTIAPTGGWQKGTLADHFGLPIGVENISVSSLPFRAYALTYNEWFRSENLIEPCDINMGDSTTAGSNGTDVVVDVQKGGMLAKVGRLPDRMSSALPSPQKGPDVFIPMGTASVVPVIGTEPNIHPVGVPTFTGGVGAPMSHMNNGATGFMVNDKTGDVQGVDVIGLGVDLSTVVGNATINQLRQSFAVQRLYEKDARGGTRYTEQIRAHFNVISPDARQQRPEYLGGKRVPINISQVIQTSSTDTTSPQGNTAAYSLTIDTSDVIKKSFTEHGYVLGLICIRTERTYQQGIERMWSRKNRLDYYYPTMANIGEQIIYNDELYAQGTAEDKEVFGYQEAWSEYRYKPSIITGELRSAYSTPLDAWHYGDYYTSLPVLGRDWFEETKNNVARTLAVENQDQFIADFYFNTKWVRPMPIYSVPGLIDHH